MTQQDQPDDKNLDRIDDEREVANDDGLDDPSDRDEDEEAEAEERDE